MTSRPPPASGIRLPWTEVPPRVRAALEGWLGAPVVTAKQQVGGFSPGPAVRIRAADGRRVFVKAVAPELNPDSPSIFRREGQVVGALPAAAPVPRLLWTYDEGGDGWIMLVFEDIEGRTPTQPWRAHELDQVLDAVAALSEVLTPSPIDARPAGRYFATSIRGWQAIIDGGLGPLDPWSARHLGTLADLESRAVEAVAGETLLHFDLRADNMLLTTRGVVVVDWPHACIGAPWVDLVGFAPGVAMQGGPPPEELLMRHPAVHRADPAAITATVASIAGYFTQRGLLPPPPGLPTLRAFQAAQGVEARRWLQVRTGWE